MRAKPFFLALILALSFSLAAGCAEPAGIDPQKAIAGLTFEETLAFDYAKSFTTDVYKDGYLLVSVLEQSCYLVVPEGKTPPGGLPEDIVVLQKPFTGVYVANTPSMTLINAIGALEKVTFSGTDASEWYVQDIAEAITDGNMKFGGKYDTPDYEAMTAAGCSMVIQSTMVESVPEVKDKFAELGIPIFVDQSGTEEHPLGRVEWMKLYALLFDVPQADAEAVFAVQEDLVNDLSDLPPSDKTAAIFYITSQGLLYVRNTDDYLVSMVRLAGGTYIPSELGNTGSNSTQMDMESYYAQAKDADIIIYVYSIGGRPETLADLKERHGMIEEFAAYKNGNVWCTCPEFFQVGDVLGAMIGDINTVLTRDDAPDTLTYLFRLK